jgi:hypothetical protein
VSVGVARRLFELEQLLGRFFRGGAGRVDRISLDFPTQLRRIGRWGHIGVVTNLNRIALSTRVVVSLQGRLTNFDDGYCLADPGHEYVVFLNAAAPFTLTLAGLCEAEPRNGFLLRPSELTISRIRHGPGGALRSA